MSGRRWDSDQRGRGIADARASLPAIEQLAELAAQKDWVAEDAEAHLLPGLRDRVAITGFSLDATETRPDGVLLVRLSTTTQLSQREVRQSVWSILGGAVELTSLVRETKADGVMAFDVVTGIAPGDGVFATHGHTLRIEVTRPA